MQGKLVQKHKQGQAKVLPRRWEQRSRRAKPGLYTGDRNRSKVQIQARGQAGTSERARSRQTRGVMGSPQIRIQNHKEHGGAEIVLVAGLNRAVGASVCHATCMPPPTRHFAHVCAPIHGTCSHMHLDSMWVPMLDLGDIASPATALRIAHTCPSLWIPVAEVL